MIPSFEMKFAALAVPASANLNYKEFLTPKCSLPILGAGIEK
jgi:hypothetical protein